ncbi:guanine nucleotide-binding protein subunit beta-2-like 1 protein [Pancytospora philotis]|nr:guanine nucleotide-binding protein subunit beta-2-like 1 protein [Pancytospora philotis]
MASVAMRLKESIHISKFAIQSVKAINTAQKTRILLGSRDGNVLLIDLEQDLTNGSSKIMKSFEGKNKHVTGVEYSPVGDKVISVTSDCKLNIWDIATKKRLVVSGHNRKITDVALNTDNNKIITASEDESFILWNVMGQTIKQFGRGMENSHKGWINATGFIPNYSDMLATASEDGTVKIWNVETNCLLKTFMDGALVDYDKAKETKLAVKDYDVDYAVKALSFSKDGSLLVYGGRNSKVYLVSHVQNETLQTIDVPDKVIALASGENQPLIAISIPNKILLWNIIDSKLVGTYEFAEKGEHYCYSMVFCGDELIAGLADGNLIRIDIARN